MTTSFIWNIPQTRRYNGLAAQPTPKAVGCSGALCSTHFDDFAFAARFGDRKTLLLQSSHVELDGLSDELEDFMSSFPGSDASGQIGYMCPPALISTFND